METKLWTKVEPESELKINNFASATLLKNTFFLLRSVVLLKIVETGAGKKNLSW